MKGAQGMMTTPWNHVILEHKGICVAFLIYGIVLKNISNNLVGDANIVFLFILYPIGLFINVHVLFNIP